MVVKYINEQLCIGCGLCRDVCTEDVFRFDELKRKPIIKHPKDCVSCLFCECFCPVGAIEIAMVRTRKLPEVL